MTNLIIIEDRPLTLNNLCEDIPRSLDVLAQFIHRHERVVNHGANAVHQDVYKRQDLTIVIVTHNMQQATRIADRTAFMYMGRLCLLYTSRCV